MFQSTHPHGVRPCSSTHRHQRLCFNPRTRTGCDIISSWIRNIGSEFQSTHPHGVRHHPFSFCNPCLCFNPRTRTGCDGWFLWSVRRNFCFNPRTRTGCDQSYKIEIDCADVSIHAPARGATPIIRRVEMAELFQSTHPHGVRHSARISRAVR